MSQIEHVHARQILDSRGNPTVEVELSVESGACGRAAVPSGASTGEHEAAELRDGGAAWMGKGVSERGRQRQRRDRRGGRAAGTRPTRPASTATLIDARRHRQQVAARRERDPRRLARGRHARGGRGAACRCSATSAATTPRILPVPMMNVINGGAHADNPVDFQEFMIVPVGAPNFSEAMRMGDRGLPPAQEDAARARPRDRRSATRAASRRTSSPTRRRSSC